MINDKRTLKAIKKKILEAKSILIEVDKLYDPLREKYTGSFDNNTGNSDQSMQITLMNLNDSAMLLNHELKGSNGYTDD